MAAITASLGVAATSDRRLIRAVRNQDAKAVRELLEKRVEVNATQGDGSTALHWAVHLDDLATAELLIRSGAQVNAANDVGVTPLHLACTNRSGPMVERLLAAGGPSEPEGDLIFDAEEPTEYAQSVISRKFPVVTRWSVLQVRFRALATASTPEYLGKLKSVKDLPTPFPQALEPGCCGPPVLDVRAAGRLSF